MFKVLTSRAVGTAPITVGNYTCNSADGATIIGLSVSNVIDTEVLITVRLFDGTNHTHVLKGATTSPGQTQVLVGGEQKIVLMNGHSISVSSNTANSVDVIMSILEV